MGPDGVLHAFRTFLGMPPSKDDLPACGAVLSDAYDFPAEPRPVCPACAALVALGET